MANPNTRSISLFAVFVTCAVLGLQPIEASAQSQCLDYSQYPLLEITLDLPGEAHRMAMSGSHLYVAGGASGLQVVDMEDINAPVKIGSYNSPGQARGVALEGELLYLADGDQGLTILDVSNPVSPQRLGSVNTTGFIHEVVVRDGLAYLAAGWGSGGLIIVDVTDPSVPTLVSITPAGGDVRGLVLKGHHAYLADFTGHLYTLDVTDPLVPVANSQVATISQPTSLSLSNDHLVVSCYHRGIQVFSLTAPDTPQLASSYGLDQGLSSHFGNFVSCEGNMTCVTGTSYVMALIDLTDPAAPVLEKYLDLNHSSPKTLIHQGVVFAGYDQDGLELKQIEGWGLPTPIGHLNFQTEIQPGAIAAFGDLAVVASSGISSQDNRLNIVRMQNENVFSLTGWISTGARLQDVVVSGHYAFAAFTYEMKIIDLQNPNDPLVVANIPMSSLGRLAVDGNLLYLGGFDVFGSDVLVLDISDPTAPMIINDFYTTSQCTGLTLTENRLYISSEHHVQVFDRSDPTHPVFLERLMLSEGTQDIQDITIQDGFLYVCVEESGVQVRNLAHTSLPQVALIEMPDPHEISFNGTAAYISDMNKGLAVVDNSDPFHPEVMGWKNGQARASLPHDGRLLVSGSGIGIGGLESIPLQCGSMSPAPDEVPSVSTSGLHIAPNPFNPQTRISLSLEKGGPVSMTVYDMAGRKVRHLAENEWLSQGRHERVWNGRDDTGRGLPSGTYLVRLRAGSDVMAKPVTLLK